MAKPNSSFNLYNSEPINMKHLKDYFPYPPTMEQEAACDAMEAFIADSNPEHRIFILKGHAGTGKTTILLALKYFLQNKRELKYLATTGRASKILKEKTQMNAETIHKYIYSLKQQKYGEEKDSIRKLEFGLRRNRDDLQCIYAVDESSMLSNKVTKTRMLSFGTGRLMSDFIHFSGSRKIIFVGDPAQLPPVNTNFSAALTEHYIYEKFGKHATSASLTQVMRFDKYSFIGDTTTNLRKYLTAQSFPYLSVKVTGYKDVKLFYHPNDMAHDYAIKMRKHGLENQILLTFSNAAAYTLNEQIRNNYYQGISSLKEGDLMMVYQNNYLHDLFNGDQVIIEKIHGSKESHYGFDYLDVSLRMLGERSDKTIKAKMLLDFMNQTKPSMSPEDENKMLRNLIIRAAKMDIDKSSSEFLDFMIKDPYFNALRLKFGYAITTHKSQGGEWKDVYVLLEKSIFYQPKEFQYRWLYTAISRATENVKINTNRCLY